MPPEPPAFLLPGLAAPVAVLGDGISGRGVRGLLSSMGAATAIYDSRGAEFTAEAARRHLLAVVSPGFAPGHPWLERARSAGCQCLTEIDFGSLFWRGRVLAVTGTNGKTTLTEFLAHALRRAGRSAHVAGNIGFSLSRLANEADGGGPQITAVCEVSSFQAEQMRHFRADAALWTNFAEDHLERHPGMEAYFRAKWGLVGRTEEGRLYVGSSVQRHAADYGLELPEAARVATEGQPADSRLAGTPFADYPQRENFLLAAAWWHGEELDEDTLYAAARSFRIGRHRLARVGQIRGVTFWNDSKATNFHAVEAAVAGFPEPVVLIAGGKSKGGDIDGFVRRVAPKVRHAFLIGETKDRLAESCADIGIAHTTSGALEEAVRAAAEAAGPGENVLLSPGFASFDMFHNYEDRGDRFEQAVRELGGVNV